jgi:hypothetical protein
MGVFLSRGLGCTMAAKVMMVVPMRWRRDYRVRNPALLADLHLLGRFVIVFVASSLGVRGESSQRGLIHVAGERDLRVAHAQRSRVLRLLCYHCCLSIMMAIGPGSDGEGGNNTGRPSTALRTWLLLRRLTQ